MTINCFSCRSIVNVEPGDDPTGNYPVYGGLIFRSTGNYGSTVFDPMPTGREEVLRIIICDNCIKKNSSCVTHIYKIRRSVTADTEEFMS